MKVTPRPGSLLDRALAGPSPELGRTLAGLPLAAILTCVLAEGLALRLGIDDLDEGYFVQQATRVLHGQVPYRDFETLYTPGLVYLHAALFSIQSAVLGVVGGANLVGPRVLALLARAALALLLYALARPLVRHAFWAAVPGMFLLVALDDAPQRWEPHPGWLSAFFAVLAAWCMSRPSHPRSWLVAAGTSAAAAYAFKQNTGVFILAAMLLQISAFGAPRGEAARSAGEGSLRASGQPSPSPSPKGRGRPAAGPWERAGGLLLVFAAFTAVWFAPLVIALRGDFTRLGGFVGAINQAGLFSPPEPSISVPLLCLAAGVRIAKDPRIRWLLLSGSALFLTQYPRMDTLHLAWSAPILLVVGAIALDRLNQQVAVLTLAGALLLSAPLITARLDFVQLPTAPIADVHAPAQTATELSALVTDIQQRTAPSSPIFVYPTSPLVYVLADRPNPTRFDHLNPGAASPLQIAQVITDLTTSDVRLVVISDFWHVNWGPPGPNAALETWLADRYTEVARHGAYRVLVAGL
jgi:hypothetical protein